MEREEIFALRVVDLKERLRELNLPTTGRKSTLQDRLLHHFNLAIEIDDDDETSEYGDAASIRSVPIGDAASVHSLPIGDAASVHSVAVGDAAVARSVAARDVVHNVAAVQGSAGNNSAVRYVERNSFTLRDIQDSMTSFDGTNQPSIEDWISDFEVNAIAVRWTDLQKFIYSKQLLKGAAKAFVRSQRAIVDWHILCAALRAEFGVKESALDIHRRMGKRRKKSNEDYREYLYSLMEIGSEIKMDDLSIIEYFIEGIGDSKANKINLYQARTIAELKDQIKIYEKIKSSSQVVAPYKAKSEGAEEKPFTAKKYFKCGNAAHLAKDCSFKNFKCFKCGGDGHRASECKQGVKVKVEKDSVNTLTLKKSCVIFKELTINAHTFTALLDTGCDLCLLRDDVFMKTGNVKLSSERKQLFGIGKGELITVGGFTTNLTVDGVDLQVVFHVVKKNDMRYAAIIGNNVLGAVDLVVSEQGVRFVAKQSKSSQEVVVCANKHDNLQTAETENDETVVKVAQPNAETDKEFQQMCMMSVDNDESTVDLTHVKKEAARVVAELLKNYTPMKGQESPIAMKILVTDDRPVFQRPRHMPYVHQQIVDQQVSEWLQEGIIQPSNSEYAAPVVLAGKKDGTKRLCCDYRRLNEKIVRDNFPMPLVDAVLERLQSAMVYTTLDLANGFFHIPMDEGSRKFTSFVTNKGQYEFLFMPFGICNSPAVFSRFICAIFRDLIQDGIVIAYMDDLVIPSKDIDEGVQKLVVVLKRAAEYGLRIRWKKCQMLKTKIDFLGYVVEGGTIKPSKLKTMAVENFPVPRDRKAVQRYLGLTSFFRRFIEGYAIVAKPLSDLLKQNVEFKMEELQLVAFQQLKAALVSAPILRLYDPKAQTEVHTDASMYGYGGVLLQKDRDDQQLHPVEYMSRKTKPEEERYHSYELEVLAVVRALQKWRVYLLGIEFKIITDCNAFAMTMRKEDVPARVSRWALFMQDFKYKIEHRSGNKMRHVDALSRVHCLLLEDSLHHKLCEAQKTDEWIQAVMKALEAGEYKDFYVSGGVLHKDPVKELLVIPSEMEADIIKTMHNEGHYAAARTQEAVEQKFYIPELKKKVDKIVRGCVRCIITDHKAGKKEGLLSPIPKEDCPLSTYHIDHVGPMQETKKSYNYLLVLVDGFSKFVWIYPTRSTGTEEVISKLEVQASIFGNPRRIISDRGTAFTSKSFEEYCRSREIEHFTITTGVPRGNGQVERIHRVIVPMLAKVCAEKPETWYKHVSRVQQAINNTPPRSTKHSPFRVLTGIQMRVNVLPDLQQMLEEESLKELDQEREAIREEAKSNIIKLQHENKQYFDAKRKKAVKYAINELVAIRRTQFGTSMKLRPKYLGPYKVTKVSAHDRYEVQKVGDHEGPNRTSTTAEYMKKWGDVGGAFGPNEQTGWPNVG